MDEFTFRLNDNDVKRHTLERLANLLMASTGRYVLRTYGAGGSNEP